MWYFSLDVVDCHLRDVRDDRFHHGTVTMVGAGAAAAADAAAACVVRVPRCAGAATPAGPTGGTTTMF